MGLPLRGERLGSGTAIGGDVALPPAGVASVRRLPRQAVDHDGDHVDVAAVVGRLGDAAGDVALIEFDVIVRTHLVKRSEAPR